MRPNDSAPRSVEEVAEIIEKRYGCGQALLDAYLDHDCIFCLETLISYGPEEADAASWQEYMAAAGKVNLDAAAMGAYEYFLSICRENKLDLDRTFDCFSEAAGYWGVELQAWEQIERAGETASGYEKEGKRVLRNISRRNARAAKKEAHV